MEKNRTEYKRKYYKMHKKHLNELQKKYYDLHPERHYYGLSHYPIEVRRIYTERVWRELKKEEIK